MRLGRRIMIVAFVLAAAATATFGLKLLGSAVYWSAHKEQPIAGWMTLGMVARSYDVPRSDLAVAVGLPAGTHDRRPLSEIARERGVPEDEVVRAVEDAIAAARAGGAAHGEGARP